MNTDTRTIDNVKFQIIDAEKAKEMLKNSEVYALYSDGTEALINLSDDIDGFKARGIEIGVEVIDDSNQKTST